MSNYNCREGLIWPTGALLTIEGLEFPWRTPSNTSTYYKSCGDHILLSPCIPGSMYGHLIRTCHWPQFQLITIKNSTYTIEPGTSWCLLKMSVKITVYRMALFQSIYKCRHIKTAWEVFSEEETKQHYSDICNFISAQKITTQLHNTVTMSKINRTKRHKPM